MENLEEVKLERDVRDGVKVARLLFADFVAKLMERINRDALSNHMEREHLSIVTFQPVRVVQKTYWFFMINMVTTINQSC